MVLVSLPAGGWAGPAASQLFGQEFSISVSTSREDLSKEIQSVMPVQKVPVPTAPGI